MPSVKPVPLLASFALFSVILIINPFSQRAETNSLALLLLSITLWATEALPLFVTSLMVPFLIVTLRTTVQNGIRLSAEQATKTVMADMFSPTILVLLGGFTLSASWSKYQLDSSLARAVLSVSGARRKALLAGHMAVALISSMFISNVCAPTLSYSLVAPLLHGLPKGSPYAKSLVLGIAIAANIGGMASPIASPQNLIALAAMDPQLDWAIWFAVALPVCLISVTAVYIFLLAQIGTSDLINDDFASKPDDGYLSLSAAAFSFQQQSTNNNNLAASSNGETESSPIAPADKRAQAAVAMITGLTILLWCVSHRLSGIVGDSGIISLIPLVLIFGSGLLVESDFVMFKWTVIFLAMGGIALGKSVLASGLLGSIDVALGDMLASCGILTLSVLFGLVTLLVSTCVSHTVAAVLLVPIAQDLGAALGHARLMIFVTALLCSAGMGLPVSGFPNITASDQRDLEGRPYLHANDFLAYGIPASIIAFCIVCTFGFTLMFLFHL